MPDRSMSTGNAGAPYDPFAPGPYEIGQRTIEVTDALRDRTLPVEVWAPIGVMDDAALPLVVYSHSSYGSRLQVAGLLRHLASHGYVAAAPDHLGNTLADLGRGPTDVPFAERVAAMIEPRAPDLQAVISAMLGRAGFDDLPPIEPSRVATIGWSFGGWAALATPEVDDRVAAVVAMVPGGASDPLPGIIPAKLTFAWHRPVETLVLAADADRFTPLDRVTDVYRRAPEPKRGFVLLGGADHEQFSDEPDVDRVPRAVAHAFRNALTLAHLDASLARDSAAGAWLDGASIVDLARTGVEASRLA